MERVVEALEHDKQIELDNSASKGLPVWRSIRADDHHEGKRPATLSNRQAAKLLAYMTERKPDPPRITKLIKNNQLRIEDDGRVTFDTVVRYAESVLAKKKQQAKHRPSDESSEVGNDTTCFKLGCNNTAPLFGKSNLCKSCLLLDLTADVP